MTEPSFVIDEMMKVSGSIEKTVLRHHFNNRPFFRHLLQKTGRQQPFTDEQWLWDEDYNDECENTFELQHIELEREAFWGFE